MGQCEATRQSDWIMPLMAGTDNKAAGAAIAVTTVAAYVDLSTVPGVPVGLAGPAVSNPSPIGHYLTLTTEGGDVYVLFGPAATNVSGANAPLATATNTITAGVWAGAIQVCDYIPAGTTVHVKIPAGSGVDAAGAPGSKSPARFLAYVTKSGTATLRIRQSSP